MAPKAVGDVIPDVRAAARSLVGFTRELLDAVGAHLEDSTCLHDLVDHLTPPVADLEEALSTAMATTMTARTRLDLERAVERSASEIESALDLVELLEEAVSARHTLVSARDLVHESLSNRARGVGRSATVELELPPSDLDVVSNARAAMGLVAIAAGMIAALGQPPRVAVRGRGAAVEIRVEPGRGEGRTVEADVARIIAPSRPCAEAVARAIGANLEVEDDGRCVVLTFAASP